MSSKLVHKAQAEHNERAAQHLLNTEFLDWSCTSAFYSALHYVESAFFDIPLIQHTDECFLKNKSKIKAEKGDISVHIYREILVGKVFPRIRTSYRQLWEVSEQVRYLDKSNRTAFEFITKNTAERLVNSDLNTVKSSSVQAQPPMSAARL